MKKQLLILIAIVASFQISMAQDKVVSNRKTQAIYTTVQRNAHPTRTAGTGIFYSNDFSDPLTWTASNQVGNSDDWVVGTGVPSGSFAIAGIQSTTFSNGFGMFDSDLLCSGNQIADLTTTDPIDCSGRNIVQLQFEEFYERFDDSTMVLISNDNATWTAFPVHVGLGNNAATTNPNIINIDISSVAANQDSVYIRFEFYSPSTFVGPAGAPGCGYAWMVDDVTLSESCSAPLITAATQVVCPGSTVQMSFTNNPNQTYQWESSSDNITWTPISGAFGSNYTATITATQYFHVIADCGGGLLGTSASFEVASNPTAPFCYCIPFSLTCNGTDFIQDVNISTTGFSYTSDCDTFEVAGLSNYTFVPTSTTTATLAAGTAYNLNVTTNNDNNLSLWIDYDQNGVYDAAEWTEIATTSVAGAATTMSITVPTTALNGLTGMRIRSRLTGFTNDATSACINMGSGETEDFFVTITGGVGIGENEFANASFSPSVTANMVTVDLGTANISNANLVVYDMLGNVVINNKAVDHQKFDISLGAFDAGIYIVRVYNGASNFNGKVTLVK